MSKFCYITNLFRSLIILAKQDVSPKRGKEALVSVGLLQPVDNWLMLQSTVFQSKEEYVHTRMMIVYSRACCHTYKSYVDRIPSCSEQLATRLATFRICNGQFRNYPIPCSTSLHHFLSLITEPFPALV